MLNEPMELGGQKIATGEPIARNEGVRCAWGHTRLRYLQFFFVGVMLVGFLHVTLISSLLENQLGRSATDLTHMALFFAISALSASLFVARYADSRHAK